MRSRHFLRTNTAFVRVRVFVLEMIRWLLESYASKVYWPIHMQIQTSVVPNMQIITFFENNCMNYCRSNYKSNTFHLEVAWFVVCLQFLNGTRFLGLFPFSLLGKFDSCEIHQTSLWLLYTIVNLRQMTYIFSRLNHFSHRKNISA